MEQDFASNAPPRQQFSSSEIPIVHLATELYKKTYQTSAALPKKDRLGIFLKIESSILEILASSVEAAFLARREKLPTLHQLRREAETVKRLIRVANELKIVERRKYVELSADLQQISKMANGWIKSLT